MPQILHPTGHRHKDDLAIRRKACASINKCVIPGITESRLEIKLRHHLPCRSFVYSYVRRTHEGTKDRICGRVKRGGAWLCTSINPNVGNAIKTAVVNKSAAVSGQREDGAVFIRSTFIIKPTGSTAPSDGLHGNIIPAERPARAVTLGNNDGAPITTRTYH